MSGNKKEAMFAKLAMQQARGSQDNAAPIAEAAGDSPPSPALPEAVTPKAAPTRKKAEPAKGKRENPDYCQANAYVPKKLRRAVDKALFDVEGLDYSSLVEDLLRKWLKSRGVSE
jgi:hypothetical protein